MSDSSEDDPNNPPIWRSPCICSLTAHESCLLDWVADLENPTKNNKRKPRPQILCPQCKSEIKISRPRNLVVDTYRALDYTAGTLVWPGLGLGLLTSLYAGAWLHGFHSVQLVFGEREASRIYWDALRHRSWVPAYALVPLNLIFARTNYADFVLPSGTLFLLATQIGDKFEIDMTIWPPLPSTVFACLPAVRTAYNWCYHKAFCDLNKKWLEEVQPRHAAPDEDQDGNDGLNQNRGGGEIVLELEVNINAGGNGEGGGQADEEVNGDEGGDAQGQAEGGHAQHLLGDRGDRFVAGTSSIGQTILGALSFPAVAAGMGTLLSYVIPSSWLSNSNYMRGRPGLMRTKWGRSVVGGCLFVVLKDVLVLYCRWKLAQSHRHRRVMNFDKKTKKYSV